MRYRIVEEDEFSGEEAHIYSLIINDEEDTLLDQFIKEYQDSEDVEDILLQLMDMGKYSGCQEFLIKKGEGKLGDGVCALWAGNLRLYIIYFNRTAIIVGGGGYKNTRTWQEDKNLSKNVILLEKISASITKKMNDGCIKLHNNGVLELDEEEYETD